MRCPYCYNPEIVNGKGRYSYEDVLSFLNTRRGLLDGVVLSGGECTAHRSIIDLARKIKALGFRIKIDTNGSHPRVVQALINEGLLDFVALDMKAPLKIYSDIAGIDTASEFEQSFTILLKSNIPFEVRTTYHSDLLSTEDILSMYNTVKLWGYGGIFYVQNFLKDSVCIKPMGYSQPLYEGLFTDTPLIRIRN